MGKTFLPPVQAGQQIWEWTVIDPALRIRYGGRMRRAALVLCSCSTAEHPVEKTVTWDHLRSGNDKSCGHYQAECGREKIRKIHRLQKAGLIRTASQRTHGMSGHPVYSIWSGMIQRCHNPRNDQYKNYGARGIKVCPEWRDSFQPFYDHVTQLDHYGEPGRTLNRIDNDGPYAPGNVEWATAEEQSQNSRNAALTADTVRAIRALYDSTRNRSIRDREKWTMRRLAATFGVHAHTVERVIYRESWKNVE